LVEQALQWLVDKSAHGAWVRTGINRLRLVQVLRETTVVLILIGQSFSHVQVRAMPSLDNARKQCEL
jgi:tRNA U38,U39,U40 pseudouridine synthase TruA